MPPESNDAAYLWDMLDAARDVMEFTGGKSFEEFESNKMLQAAVERKIEIIGEAARKVSDNFKGSHPEIPWRRVVGQRHVLAHEYGDIEQEIIWRLVKTNIPELINALGPLIPPSPED